MNIKYKLDRRIALFFILSHVLFVVFLAVVIVLLQDSEKAMAIFILATVFVLVNCVVFYLFIFKTHQKMRKQFHDYNLGGDLEGLQLISVHYSDEIKGTMNKMMSQVESYDILESMNKQAAYLALQNQINPHFLYNTLEAIRADALMAGAKNVAEITEALAVFFRYTISNTDALVSLEEELTNTKNYYAIQKYRFMDKISLVIDMEPDSEKLFHCLMPKLTIQPLIENAIVHGLEPKVGKGTIEITIKSTKERLILRIKDDGVGMCETRAAYVSKQLIELNGSDKDERKGGIALTNVNNRIKLLFGEKYGLYLQSVVGMGTIIDVVLPIMMEKNEYERDY